MSGWWIAALVLAVANVVYRAFQREPNRLVVEEHTVPVANLPAALEELEILHVSDLHLSGRMGDRERHLIDIVRSSDAPVLVLTGDFIAEDAALGQLVPILMEMTKGKQAFAVLGDEDYSSPGRLKHLLSVIEGSGVTVLRNRAVTLSAQGEGSGHGGVMERLWLVGIDDPVTAKADVAQAFAAVGQAVAEAEARTELEDRAKAEGSAEEGAYDGNGASPRSRRAPAVVALAHSPAVVEDAVKRGAGLVLAGHTHGGKVRLPGIGPLMAPPGVERRFAGGMARWSGASVFVNSGYGTPGVKVRWGVPPAVALLRLVGGGVKAE